jgi:hypothetical protein
VTPDYFIVVFGNVFQFTVIALALWQGQAEERITAGALFANIIASKLSMASGWHEPEWLVLLVDTLLLALMIWLAIRTERWWLLWCSAFQLLSGVTHVAIAADPTLMPRAYWVSTLIWTYMVLFALGAGTWGAWTRRRRMRSAAAAYAEPTQPHRSPTAQGQ